MRLAGTLDIITISRLQIHAIIFVQALQSCTFYSFGVSNRARCVQHSRLKRRFDHSSNFACFSSQKTFHISTTSIEDMAAAFIHRRLSVPVHHGSPLVHTHSRNTYKPSFSFNLSQSRQPVSIWTSHCPLTLRLRHHAHQSTEKSRSQDELPPTISPLEHPSPPSPLSGTHLHQRKSPLAT